MRQEFAVMMRRGFAAADDGGDGEVCGFDGPDGRCWRSGRNVLVKADAASLVFHCSGRQHLSRLSSFENNSQNKNDCTTVLHLEHSHTKLFSFLIEEVS